MIRNTFLFLKGIGEKKEKRLWKENILDWDDFLNSEIKWIDKHKSYYDRKILEARRRLYSYDSSYFSKILPQSEHWRLYDFFKDELVCMDIEIGGTPNNPQIIIITLYDGYNTRTFIRGYNFDKKIILEELRRYKILMTFNGSSFDLPILKKHIGTLPEIPHIDVMHLCRKFNLLGGLKKIEKELGISRRANNHRKTQHLTPIRLWRKYAFTRDPSYIEELINYNEEDTINIWFIAQKLIPALKKEIFQPRKNH